MTRLCSVACINYQIIDFEDNLKKQRPIFDKILKNHIYIIYFSGYFVLTCNFYKSFKNKIINLFCSVGINGLIKVSIIYFYFI